ncbi:GNAT family N-acetyltransferase [Ruania alba]|uniref:GNAT family N-acetyltransferase n=1 Tax=Ruania alba TaxID=648782 RepID=UPI000B7D8EF7
MGIGVLHPDGANRAIWPSGSSHVLLRGFSIDTRCQGQGIGTTATGAAVALAQRAYPLSDAIVLTVHVDNIAGQRAYARAGFAHTGRTVPGRTGEEYVMSRPLHPAKASTAAMR